MACLVNVHFSDIPHTFILHFTLHSAEKNPHRIFRKLPLDNFPQSAFRKIHLPIGLCLKIKLLVYNINLTCLHYFIYVNTKQRDFMG